MWLIYYSLLTSTGALCHAGVAFISSLITPYTFYQGNCYWSYTFELKDDVAMPNSRKEYHIGQITWFLRLIYWLNDWLYAPIFRYKADTIRFWCTRCAFRLIKCLHRCLGQKRWKSRIHVKNVKEPTKTKQRVCVETLGDLQDLLKHGHKKQTRSVCETQMPSDVANSIKSNYFVANYSDSHT
jgi:hypothetical protein